jgi:hypothetical protein
MVACGSLGAAPATAGRHGNSSRMSALCAALKQGLRALRSHKANQPGRCILFSGLEDRISVGLRDARSCAIHGGGVRKRRHFCRCRGWRDPGDDSDPIHSNLDHSSRASVALSSQICPLKMVLARRRRDRGYFQFALLAPPGGRVADDLRYGPHPLVLFQCDSDGFSAAVVFRRKAPCAGNGPALVKHGNAAAGHHRSAQGVGLSASMAALHLLPRATTLRFELRLALNADRPTESVTITLKEY